MDLRLYRRMGITVTYGNGLSKVTSNCYESYRVDIGDRL